MSASTTSSSVERHPRMLIRNARPVVARPVGSVCVRPSETGPIGISQPSAWNGRSASDNERTTGGETKAPCGPTTPEEAVFTMLCSSSSKPACWNVWTCPMNSSAGLDHNLSLTGYSQATEAGSSGNITRRSRRVRNDCPGGGGLVSTSRMEGEVLSPLHRHYVWLRLEHGPSATWTLRTIPPRDRHWRRRIGSRIDSSPNRSARGSKNIDLTGGVHPPICSQRACT